MEQNKKHINRYGRVPMKGSNGWLKGLRQFSILFLALLLQAKMCGSRSKQSRLTLLEYRESIKGVSDLSKPEHKKGLDRLYLAVKDKNSTLVQVILERINADKKKNKQYTYAEFPNAVNQTSQLTPLGLAIKHGSLDIVAQLIKNEYIDVNKAGTKAAHNLPSFAYAIEQDKFKIAKRLFSLGNKQLDISSSFPTTGESSLQLAIRKKFKGIISALMDRLVREGYDLWSKKDANHRTFLHTAARYDQLKEVLANQNLEQELNKNLKCLFERDINGDTVFANAYLRPSGTLEWGKYFVQEVPGVDRVTESPGVQSFGYLLHLLGKNLDKYKGTIERDILASSRGKKNISDVYANKLLKVLEEDPSKYAPKGEKKRIAQAG